MTKRVAVISDHASPLSVVGGVDAGGQNVYVGAVATHLARIGYEVDVFTRKDREAIPEVVELAEGVRIVHVPAGPPEPIAKEELLPHMPAFAEFVERFIRGDGTPVQLVHANFFMSGVAALALQERLGLPFVMTFHALGRVRRIHQGEEDRFPDERFQIEQRIVDRADHIIAECPQDEEDLIRLYGADPVRISIVPAGFDPDELRPVGRELARAALGLPADERIVLHVGRMVPRKGVDDLIRGFAVLRARTDEPARLVIVGGESETADPQRCPEIARLMRVARDEGVADHVTFMGRASRDRLRYIYSAADVFATTPWYEPFGITPLEAMACGTPVLGSNVGGIKFTVRDGETGYLVPPHDPAAIGDRLQRLLEDRRLLRVLQNQSIRRVQSLFTWRDVVSRIAQIYERVAPQGSFSDPATIEGYARIESGFAAASAALAEAGRVLPGALVTAATTIAEALDRGGKLLICGNGGSAAESSHLAAELVGRFQVPDREGLAAIALTTDTAVLTAWANDIAYEDVFSRQIAALGRPGDVLLAISTSGRSPNVLRALETARHRGLVTVALLGAGGGPARTATDVPIVVPVDDTQRIQEIHVLLIHLLSELIESSVSGAVQDPVADEMPASEVRTA